MRAHLYGAVAGIGDVDRDSGAVCVHHDIAVSADKFARRQFVHSAAHRLMHGDEFCAVGEGGLHLHIVNHFSDAIHHLISAHYMCACLHQLRNALSIARAFNDKVRDEGDGFRIVQLDPALQPLSRNHGRHGYEQLVFFTRR